MHGTHSGPLEQIQLELLTLANGAGVILREFRRLSACFGVGYPFYRHPQSALDVTRLPTAQFRIESTRINIS